LTAKKKKIINRPAKKLKFGINSKKGVLKMIEINVMNVITIGLIAVAAVFALKFGMTYFKIGNVAAVSA
jgi:hypothetical protein